MSIETWDPHAASEDELRAHYDFALAIDDEVDPETPFQPFELWRQDLLQTSPFRESKRWAVKDGDAFVAAGGLGLNRTDDNLHLAHFDINVRQDKRRTGIARAMLRLIADAAEADGRSTLATGTPKDTVGEQFLASVGLEQKLLDRRSRLRVAEVDRSLVESWIVDAKAKAPEYSLVLFDGRVPDEHVEALIDLEETMNDAPRDGLDLEDEHQTVEQFRDGEKRLFERGTTWRYLVARHDPTNELAGFTTLSWHPLQPEVVWQWGTAVRREHRGHALGRWLKASNFTTLLEANPQAEFIDTWNAGSNKWMLAINDDLGFRPYIWYTAWDAKIDAIKKAIA
jgi:GNAT superfamily N-acetyltransferase